MTSRSPRAAYHATAAGPERTPGHAVQINSGVGPDEQAVHRALLSRLPRGGETCRHRHGRHFDTCTHERVGEAAQTVGESTHQQRLLCGPVWPQLSGHPHARRRTVTCTKPAAPVLGRHHHGCIPLKFAPYPYGKYRSHLRQRYPTPLYRPGLRMAPGRISP